MTFSIIFTEQNSRNLLPVSDGLMDTGSAETHDGLMDLFRDKESSESVWAADVRIWVLHTPFPSAASRRQEPLTRLCLILTLPSVHL